LAYDNVMSKQRDYIYGLRRGVLLGKRDVIEAFLAEAVEENEEGKNIIENKRVEFGEEQFMEITRRLILQNIDMFWMEHLEMMNYTRSSVNLRAYGQRDPLIEYKKEGSRLFAEMQHALKANVIALLPNVNINAFAKEEENAKKVFQQAQEAGGSDQKEVRQVVHPKPRKDDGTKVGRNDPCPCGSGKKYKKCHGA